MTIFWKIVVSWLALVVVVALSFLLFSHSQITLQSQIVNSLLFLIGIVSINIFLRERNRRSKVIFLNFSVYFLLSIGYFVYPFVGVLFPQELYASHYFYQYVLCALIVVSLAFSLVYAALDTILTNMGILKKYLTTAVIVGGFFLYYYSPILNDPQYLYKTEDIADWRIVDQTVSQLKSIGIQDPKPEQVSEQIGLNAWKDGKPVGLLFPDENIRRIQFIMPYLEGNNYLPLLMKPLHLNVIYLDVLSVVFLFTFFGYQYKKDPPQGAYVEKILFLFLPFCSLEALHFYTYIMVNDFSTFLQIFNIAQYLVICNLLLLLVFFSLRLSFISSIKGEFYERELVLDSEHISRWRDGIDNLVVRHFLNPKTIHGRLFAPREAKSRT
ncbi:MAG TPA: hypothetical protein VJB38_14695 [Bacteroidota bacterium]|nr:hypothetical protein [Bacteroidota bacterium]